MAQARRSDSNDSAACQLRSADSLELTHTYCPSGSYSKVWDTFSGKCLHTFSHNHIVRSVAIDAEGSRIFTGGHEKKLRLFDLNRPDADPLEFSNNATKGTAHEGNIKSVVWQRGAGQNAVVSAGEDKVVRWWDIRSAQVTHEMSFDDPIVSMERSCGALGELLTIASGKSIIFLDGHR